MGAGRTSGHLVRRSTRRSQDQCPSPASMNCPSSRRCQGSCRFPAPTLGEMPDAVSEVVAECLSVDPTDRPATASEVAERLDEAASKW